MVSLILVFLAVEFTEGGFVMEDLGQNHCVGPAILLVI